MTADDCRRRRESLGAFVLGQLGPEEHAAVEAHLEGCSACRAEADLLAPVGSLLTRADPERLSPTPAPPADLGDRIARRIAAERRVARRKRVRLGIGLGAVAAGATAALLIALVFTGSTPNKAPGTTVAFSRLPEGVAVQASLQARPWGSDVQVRVRGFRPGTLCTLWLRRADGTRVPAGSFRYVYAGESDEAELSSGLEPRDVTAIGLRAGSKTFVAPVSSAAPSVGSA